MRHHADPSEHTLVLQVGKAVKVVPELVVVEHVIVWSKSGDVVAETGEPISEQYLADHPYNAH